MQKQIQINEHIELRALDPDVAREKYENVIASREHLLPWLPWVYFYDEHGVDAMRDYQTTKAQEFAYDINYTYDIFFDGDFAGSIELKNLSEANHSCEIGYWLSKSMTGKGIMTTVVNKITEIAFRNLKMHTVIILASERNAASCNVAKRCGFNLDATLPERLLIDGEYHNECVFSKINH